MAARVAGEAGAIVNPVGGAGAPGEDIVRAVGACGAIATTTAGATGVSSPLTSAKGPKMPAIRIEMSVFVFVPSNQNNAPTHPFHSS